MAKLLLAQDDINVNLKCTFGRTPLSWAAKKGHKTVVKLLLVRHDFDINSWDVDGFTPLSLAAKYGHNSVVRLLLMRPDVGVNVKGVAEDEHKSLIQLYLGEDNFNVILKKGFRQPPLVLAVIGHHEAVVKLLLVWADVDVNSRTCASIANEDQ